MILFTWMFLAQMMVSQVDAGPVLISQTGPGTGSWTTGAQESNAVSWVSSFAFSDVKIFAKLSGVGVGTAYLTTQIGPTTTAADLLAIAPFTANSTTGPEWVGLFSGLTLEPGTYFLTLGSLEGAFCGGWGNTFSPNIVTALGVTYNGSYFTTNAMAGFNLTFPPGSTFDSFETFGLNPLQFQVIMPQASTLLLMAAGFAVLCVLWRRREET